MPTKQQIITIGVLGGIALGLGYWSGMPEKDSGQRAEVIAPTVITNVVTNTLREVVTNTVAAAPQPTPTIVKPTEDNYNGPAFITRDGQSLVVNIANSGGQRFLLVNIFLVSADKNNKDFSRAISANSLKLQQATIKLLGEIDIKRLTDITIRASIFNDLKKTYQLILGEKHQIKEVLASKWILQ